MALIPRIKFSFDRILPKSSVEPGSSDGAQRSKSGVALFMVIAAMTILSMLVTEFVYIAQVNSRMAYDGQDQIKALYLCKTGLKISLLRLKAYVQIKQKIKELTGGNANAAGIPKSLIEKVWNFPFIYPIPAAAPGLTPGEKEQIQKFQDESNLAGTFTAVIESESSKYNLNQILAPFAPDAAPSPGPSSNPNPSPSGQAPGVPNPNDPNDPNATGTGGAGSQFNVESARESLTKYLSDLLQNKIENDPDFATEYRDLKMDELMDSIFAWADKTYERRNRSGREIIPLKKAPFYSVSELHMIPGMDDKLYDLFAPALTVSATPGINVNTMKESTLRALIPLITKEETEEFFKHRDSTEEDNSFKEDADFYKYITEKIGAFRNDSSEVARYKDALTKRGIRLITDETSFKITVRSRVNQATKTLEAWVTLGAQTDAKKKPNTAGNQNAVNPQNPQAPGADDPQANQQGKQPEDPGLGITFMRIL